jgi:methionine-rich copper-binding protein CopC
MPGASAGIVAGVVAGLLVVLTDPPTVAAHSLLLEARPAAGSAVPAPTRVMLRFNNRIEKRLSSATLVDPEQTRLRLVVVTTEGAADTLALLAPPLAPGTYHLEWQVLSADGHVVSGRYPFRVVP